MPSLLNDFVPNVPEACSQGVLQGVLAEPVHVQEVQAELLRLQDSMLDLITCKEFMLVCSIIRTA